MSLFVANHNGNRSIDLPFVKAVSVKHHRKLFRLFLLATHPTKGNVLVQQLPRDILKLICTFVLGTSLDGKDSKSKDIKKTKT
jgi:hypothetical protein